MQEIPRPTIEMCTLGPVETNCFVVHVPEGEDPKGCWIIDCGIDPEPLLQAVEDQGLEPRGVLLTHCHYDHIGGIESLFDRFGTLPMWVHPIEQSWNRDPEFNLSAMSQWPCVAPAPDQLYEEGDILNLGGSRWQVLHLPGHSPGSVGLLNDEAAVLIAGDTLFAGSIGRVDFPTSSEEAMCRSLTRLMTLPGETRVLPGHGPETSIDGERERNPFLRGWGLV